MNAKIRNAQNMKVPYMLVLGDREAQGKIVSVRYRDGRQVSGITVEEFIAFVKDKVSKREVL
jgi:threonyl-tRNA synthetase